MAYNASKNEALGILSTFIPFAYNCVKNSGNKDVCGDYCWVDKG